MLLIDLDLSALTGAITSDPLLGVGEFYSAQTVCDYTQIGGTACAIVVETSVDEGLTWVDTAKYYLTASGRYGSNRLSATNSSAPAVYAPLADNTARHAFAGDRLRVVVTPTGTFTAGSRLIVNYFPRYRGRNGLYF
jgi:hypothetical protein